MFSFTDFLAFGRFSSTSEANDLKAWMLFCQSMLGESI